MARLKALLACGALQLAAPVIAQQPATQAPVTIEYYYRIRWGGSEEFQRLYDKNHAPLLREMQRAGFVTAMRVDEPFTHMAGGERWDLRVTITFRDAAAAISDPGWDTLWESAAKRLYPDKPKFTAEEDRRFSLLEEHWDVVVNEVKPSD